MRVNVAYENHPYIDNEWEESIFNVVKMSKNFAWVDFLKKKKSCGEFLGKFAR